MVSEKYRNLMKEHGAQTNHDFLVGKLKKSLKRAQRYHDFIESQLQRSQEFRAFKEAEKTLKNSAAFQRWVEARDDVEEAENDLHLAESNCIDEQVKNEFEEELKGGPNPEGITITTTSHRSPPEIIDAIVQTTDTFGTCSTEAASTAYSLLDINLASPSNQGPLAASIATKVAELQQSRRNIRSTGMSFDGLTKTFESCATSDVETFESFGDYDNDDDSSDSESEYERTYDITDGQTEYDQGDQDSGSESDATSFDNYAVIPFNRLLNFERELTHSLRNLVV